MGQIHRGVKIINGSYDVDTDDIITRLDECLEIADANGWEHDLKYVVVEPYSPFLQGGGRYNTYSHAVHYRPQAVNTKTFYHEFIHHVHYYKILGDATKLQREWLMKTMKECTPEQVWSKYTGRERHLLHVYVRSYAATCWWEAVACVGEELMSGSELPDEVIDIYHELDGPEWKGL